MISTVYTWYFGDKTLYLLFRGQDTRSEAQRAIASVRVGDRVYVVF